MIRTKSIYAPESVDDGLRVLVTRYWPRGVKKEKQDVWIKDLGPSVELIKAWKAGGLKWADFKKMYLKEFKAQNKVELLSGLKEKIDEASPADTTLLCSCGDDTHCHSVILKDMIEGR